MKQFDPSKHQYFTPSPYEQEYRRRMEEMVRGMNQMSGYYQAMRDRQLQAWTPLPEMERRRIEWMSNISRSVLPQPPKPKPTLLQRLKTLFHNLLP